MAFHSFFNYFAMVSRGLASRFRFRTFSVVCNGFGQHREHLSFPVSPSLGASLGLPFVQWQHFWYEFNEWCEAERLTAHGQSPLQPAAQRRE